jgi:hypothetical protein
MMKRFPYSAFWLLVIAILTCVSTTSAHVFPEVYPMYKGKRVPLSQYYYIRIMPSPILEGFASFELCPLMQDENQDKYLVESEKIKSFGYYHHDMIHPKCERPYQMNPLGPPIYFDLRVLDDILSEDDIKVALEQLAPDLAAAGAAYVTFAALNPWLVGFSVGSALWYANTAAIFGASSMMGYYTAEATSQAIEQSTHSKRNAENKQELISGITKSKQQALLIDQNQARELTRITRIEYFAGEQADEGEDIKWPVLPDGGQTYDECHQRCRNNKDQKKPTRENKHLIDTNMIPHATETIASMNPMLNFDDCEKACQGHPIKRTTMQGIWKDLYLNTIYKAGYESKWNQHSKNELDDITDKQLHDRFHHGKHLDGSLWVTAMDHNKNKVSNHYTHKANAHHPELSSTKRYPLCDYMRLQKYKQYRVNGGHQEFAEWIETTCDFDDKFQCREYLKAPIQTGDEICTVLSEM